LYDYAISNMMRDARMGEVRSVLCVHTCAARRTAHAL